MNQFEKTFNEEDKFQYGDRVTFYHDTYGRLFGDVNAVTERTKKLKAREYNVVIGEDNYHIPETGLDRVPIARINIQLQGETERSVTINSNDLFSTITLATNYANDILQKIKKDGLNGMKITDPGLDNKVRLLRESYEYWNNEVERLYKLNVELGRK